MTEDLFDPNVFLVTGPVFILIRKGHKADEYPPMLGASKQGDYVPLFTDLDLADRFLAENPHPEVGRVALATPGDLRLYLERLQTHGINYVCFDPAERIIPLAVHRVLLALIEKLKQIGGHNDHKDGAS